MEEKKEPAEKRSMGWFGFIIIVLAFGYPLINSSNRLLKLNTIWNDKGTAITDSVNVMEISTRRTSRIHVNFEFTANGTKYEIGRLHAWWSSSDEIKDGEKFEVTYCKSRPALCLPSKYVARTFIWNVFLFLFSALILLWMWTMRPWKKVAYAPQKKN